MYLFINTINIYYIFAFCNMYMADLILRLQKSRAQPLAIIITAKIHVIKFFEDTRCIRRCLFLSYGAFFWLEPAASTNIYKSPCWNINVCCFPYKLFILRPVRRSVFGRSRLQNYVYCLLTQLILCYFVYTSYSTRMDNISGTISHG